MNLNIKDNKVLVKWCINFLIPIILLFIPCNEVFSWDIKIFCVVTAFGILIMCFELAEPIVSAMFLMLGYYLTGIATFETAFNGFTNLNGTNWRTEKNGIFNYD